MNITVFIIESLIMMLVFGISVIGIRLIDPVSFIGDYPPEIEEEYYRSQNKEASKKTMNVITVVKSLSRRSRSCSFSHG